MSHILDQFENTTVEDNTPAKKGKNPKKKKGMPNWLFALLCALLLFGSVFYFTPEGKKMYDNITADAIYKAKEVTVGLSGADKNEDPSVIKNGTKVVPTPSVKGTTKANNKSANTDKTNASPAPAPVNLEADARGRIANGGSIPAGALDRVSLGGGYAPKNPAVLSNVQPYEVSSPEMNFLMSWVPKGYTMITNPDGSKVKNIDVPVSFQAGWVNWSAAPGANQGTTVLVGHINWADGSWAPMSNIRAAQPGMKIYLADEFGNIQTFVVDSQQVISKLNLDAATNGFSTTGPRQLILVTCTPADANGHYPNNTIVKAHKVS